MNTNSVIAKRNNKTVYRDGNRKIKVYNSDVSKVEVLVSALNQAKVEETGIKMPKLLEVTTEDGKWIVVTEYIEGTPLDVLMAEHPEKEDEYLEDFVNLQMSIHTMRASGLLKIKEKMMSKIEQTDFDDTVKYELQTRLESMPNHNKVCHGDFNPSNVIVTDKGEMYVIDWAHATQGNASADVARTYLLFSLDGKEELANKYLHLFCAKSGTTKRYVQRWLPIVAASQTVKKNADEKELLNKWVNVVEYE
ncbi:MAG: phosphotransferase [Clostridia bacterium]|nr:phosphotransferase [Clostridia bacterium]